MRMSGGNLDSSQLELRILLLVVSGFRKGEIREKKRTDINERPTAQIFQISSIQNWGGNSPSEVCRCWLPTVRFWRLQVPLDGSRAPPGGHFSEQLCNIMLRDLACSLPRRTGEGPDVSLGNLMGWPRLAGAGITVHSNS